MKQYALFIAVLVALSLLTSCGPDARYPIDEHPTEKIDTRLLGKWMVTEKRNGAVSIDSDIVYTLTRKNDYEYHVLIRAKKKDSYEEDSTTAYLSKIDKEPFINIYLKDDPGGYLFLKVLNIGTNKITATSLADTMTVTNTAQVRALITKNLKNQAFYKDTIAFYRVKR